MLGRGQYLSRLAASHEPSIYAAWRLATSPAFIPLGGYPRAQCLSRLAARYAPSVCTAWRQSVRPVFIPLGGCPQAQHLSRLAAAHEPSIYPAWRLSASPAFIPLGGSPRAQRLPRLARAQVRTLHEKIPSPACGGWGSHEKNARIFFMGTREGGRRPEGGNKNPAFMPLGGPSIYAA